MFDIRSFLKEKKALLLAPMEDVTDMAFRKLCKQNGADFVYTEFVSSDALIRKVNKTLDKIDIDDVERPVAVQIYGNKPDVMAEAARVVEEVKPDVIDINFGCPVRKIAQRGAGAGLLKDIPLMVEITKAVVNAVNTPVTVKTRLGWDEKSKHIKDIVMRLQDTGIKAITIHGRTREQMYTGVADWSLIREVCEMTGLAIPVIGNGDIKTPEDALKGFTEYGVDAVMVGRAAIGAPWIFKEMKYYLENQTKTTLGAREKIDMLKHMLKANCKNSGEIRGILHTRRHLAATPLFRGLENFRKTRVDMLRSESLDEILNYLDEVFHRYFC